MGTVTLSLPDKLKQEINNNDWVNWSSVARRAFIETLKDIKELQLMKKVREISEISEDDNREVKASVVNEVVKSVESTIKKLKSGKVKSMTASEFNKWCDSI